MFALILSRIARPEHSSEIFPGRWFTRFGCIYGLLLAGANEGRVSKTLTMAVLSENDVLTALSQVRDPVSGQSVVDAGLIEGLALRGGHVSFAVEVPPQRGPASEPLRKACEDAVSHLAG